MIEKSLLETMKHIARVRDLLDWAAMNLLRRGVLHDKSKLESPEAEVFAEYTDKLSAMTYGSEEFNATKAKMKVALDHHYAHNRHHPEHWADGIDDMDLFDIIEMLLDWKASSERHHDGNILRSIEINTKRFRISGQLARILENTAKSLE